MELKTNIVPVLFGKLGSSSDNSPFKSAKSPFLKQVIELDHSLMPFPWTEAAWLEVDWRHYLLVCLQDQNCGALQGFVFYKRLVGDDYAHLLKICLKEEIRGSGLSRDLLTCAENELITDGFGRVVLEVQKENLRAVGFYQKLGFYLTHEQKGYYQNGDNALHFEKKLQESNR